MSLARLVVVGAGLAGHRAAAAARRQGFAGELVVIGAEPHHPYDRPPLSKQLLAGTIADADVYYTREAIDADWRLGQPAVALAPDAHTLTLADGSEVGYDALVIATGRRARSWPEPLGLEGFFTLRCLEDAAALAQVARPDAHAVIVGAGFIGCEVAATLRGLGVSDVHVIDVAPHPLPALGPEIGRRVAALHEAHGVHLHMSATVAAFEGEAGAVSAVRLADGQRIAADFVLLALGSVPNSEWLAGTGFELQRGAVCVDPFCLVPGRDDIAAAGDITAAIYPGFSEQTIGIEHWSNANEMAATAVRNLLAEPDQREPLTSVPAFWSDQYDIKLKSAGLPGLADRFEVVDEDPERQRAVIEAWRGSELVGVVGFNATRAIVNYTRRFQEALAV